MESPEAVPQSDHDLTYTDSLARATSQSMFLPSLPKAQQTGSFRKSQEDSWFTRGDKSMKDRVQSEGKIGAFMDRDTYEYTYSA